MNRNFNTADSFGNERTILVLKPNSLKHNDSSFAFQALVRTNFDLHGTQNTNTKGPPTCKTCGHYTIQEL